jgi:solute carrier family 25 thiamine pyrophosphate transporter 19
MPAEYLYLSYSAVEFWAYKELEQALETVDKQQQVPRTVKTFSCGMIAGCAATAATYPFDLLRTRFAVQGSQKVRKEIKMTKSLAIYMFLLQHNTSVTRAMVDIYKIEGVLGYYRGLWPAIIQIMPYMGLLFSSYDLFAKGFKKMRVIHQCELEFF